ncbi:hypothetical protein EDC94DRAFT_697766 [Helicostylum pulchrum]|nr:hypothetical protein EDC94DRAFT_697766 [Helicostylum pulchrum]
MIGCYVTSLPVPAMKTLAGFPKEDPNYFFFLVQLLNLQRPYKLWFLIKSIIGLPNLNIMMEHLRVVFLQDSVLLKRKFPYYYLWNCSLFETSIYEEFEAKDLGPLSEQDEAFLSNQRMRNAMPELVSSVQAGFGTLTTSILSLQTCRDLGYNY